jgi:histidine triad (HIT) family protein
MSECVFCRIASGAIPAKLLHHDDDVIAFPDANPQAPFHALVIPRRHVASLAEFGDGEADGRLLGALVRTAVKVARDAGYAKAERGFRLAVNTGPEGGQSVFHVHVHVLAGRTLRWPPG